MSIDVVYQGLSIAKEARVHFEEGGLFVEVEAPMPVATQLELSHSDKTPTSTFTGRVRRIREGAAPGTTPPAGTAGTAHGAGMLIAPVESEQLPRWLMALHPETVGAAQFQPEPIVEKVAEPIVEKAAEKATEPNAEKAAEAATAPSATSPEPAADASPSTRTPEHDSDDKKPAGGAKKKKAKRR